MAFDVVGFSEHVGWTGLLTAHAFLAVAAFAGGALFGREPESGTARLTCTQAVPPVRRLTAELAVPALVVTAGATVPALMFHWAWAANEDLLFTEWAEESLFVARGPVMVAYALCALAVGTLTALLLRPRPARARRLRRRDLAARPRPGGPPRLPVALGDPHVGLRRGRHPRPRVAAGRGWTAAPWCTAAPDVATGSATARPPS